MAHTPPPCCLTPSRQARKVEASKKQGEWTPQAARERKKAKERREMNQAVIETVQTLCREGNRDSVLTVFQNFPEHFSCIPLNDSNVESKQAINDLLRENVRKRPTTSHTEKSCLLCWCCQLSALRSDVSVTWRENKPSFFLSRRNPATFLFCVSQTLD